MGGNEARKHHSSRRVLLQEANRHALAFAPNSGIDIVFTGGMILCVRVFGIGFGSLSRHPVQASRCSRHPAGEPAYARLEAFVQRRASVASTLPQLNTRYFLACHSRVAHSSTPSRAYSFPSFNFCAPASRAFNEKDRGRLQQKRPPAIASGLGLMLLFLTIRSGEILTEFFFDKISRALDH